MGKSRSIGFTHIAITERCNKAFHCNELTFINKGTINVRISDCFELAPNDAISYVAWPDEVNDTVYSITPVATSSVNGMLLIAVCKKYNDGPGL